MDAEPTDIPTDLVIGFQPSGHSGMGTLTARVGPDPVYVDRLNLAKEGDRARAAAALAQDRPGIDAAAVEAELLNLAGKHVGRAPDRNKPGGGVAPGSQPLYEVVDGCLCRPSPTPFGGPVQVPLCN